MRHKSSGCIKVHQLYVIWGHNYFLARAHDHDGQWWMRAQRADVKHISRALWLCCHSALLAQEITQCRPLSCWHSVLVRREANPVNYCLAPARQCSPVSQHTDTAARQENSKHTTLTFDCSATSRWRCCIVIEKCFALWPHFDECIPLHHWWLFLTAQVKCNITHLVKCENEIFFYS